MIALIWIVSLIVLIATAVLVYKMIVTSKEYFSLEKLSPVNLFKGGNSRDKFYKQSLSLLSSKIKSLEDSNAYYEIQFSKLQLQMNAGSAFQPEIQTGNEVAIQEEDEEEDWKEMYYQENDQKVQIENELDEALQALEQANQKLQLHEEKNQTLIELKSNYDARMIEIQSLQNQVETLQKKLEGCSEREKELNSLLQKEIALKKVYAKIENENFRLRSESEDQKRQLIEIYAKEKELSKKLAHAREIQSQMGMYEEEKNRKMHELRVQMENNRIFSK
jgi:chromosome segregation ATPase